MKPFNASWSNYTCNHIHCVYSVCNIEYRSTYYMYMYVVGVRTEKKRATVHCAIMHKVVISNSACTHTIILQQLGRTRGVASEFGSI